MVYEVKNRKNNERRNMSKKKDIEKYVSGKISRMQALSDTGNGKAYMAELRKGVGKEPGELPILFGTLLEDMPEDFMSKDGIPTKEEWACYVAITLFAWHQQGKNLKTDCMHTGDHISVGAAFRKLKLDSDDANAEERVLKKLQIIITAMDINGFSRHLRSMIKMLAQNNIRLNYALLAADIYEWQFQDSRDAVNLRWGQDFYKRSKEEKENE